MKTPEEYYTEFLEEPIQGEFNGLDREIIDMIKKVQIDAYNEALKDAAEHAEMNYSGYIWPGCSECGQDGVDEQSILKLKKK